LALIVLALASSAQTITQAEYFIDIDPGVGNGNALLIAAGDSVELSSSISVSGLSAGSHTLFIRFRDDSGNWSLYEGRSFFIYNPLPPVGPIVAAEYFTNTDPGLGNGTALTVTPGDSVELSQNISVSGLAPGSHTLSIRFRDDSSHWSLSEGRIFFIHSPPLPPSPPIAKVEYFIDADPGFGHGSAFSITPGDSVAIEDSITVAGLNRGDHQISTRAMGADSTWGLYERRGFHVGIVAIDLARNVPLGGVKIGQSKDTTITITSRGSDSLHISNITSSNAVFSARPTRRDLDSSQSFLDTLRFRPTQIGLVSGTLLVFSNAPTSPDTIRVSGVGLSPILRLSGGDISFGGVPVGRLKDTTVTFFNDGNDTLRVTDVSSTNVAFRSLVASFTLPPAGSYRDTLRFQPTAIGQISASIFIRSNAPGSPHTINVTGVGQPPVDTTRPLSVSGIFPNRGGDIGSVSVVIYGNSFAQGATAKLVMGGTVIPGDPTQITELGTAATTTFDLQGKPRGVYDVVITNPSGSSASLQAGFTVEEGRAPQVWVDIIGRDVIRVGLEQTFTIIYGNRGNVDAEGVPLWIAVPKTASLKVGFDITPPPMPTENNIDWAQVPDTIQTDQEIILPLFVSAMPPSFVGTLRITLTVLTTTSFQVRVWVNPPFFSSPLSPYVKDCLPAIGGVFVNALGIVPLGGCGKALIQNFSSEAISILEIFRSVRDKPISSSLKFIVGVITRIIKLSVGDCVGDELKRLTALPLVEIIDIAETILAIPEAIVECRNVWIEQGLARLSVRPTRAWDPNEKVGSAGVGQLQYLSGEEPSRYAIFFENQETASAPAREVVVTDQLDLANMDLTTFSFGPIAFGNKRVVPLPGLKQFSTDVDLRPANNLLVRVNAQLNTATGLLTWRFTSIDPTTGQPTSDPLAGFLPPNRTPPEGEGSVLFTVMPKNGLATGTEIRNKATIAFDLNPPIDTPEWLNTIDNTKPISHVLSLPAGEDSTSFTVQWAGSDVGAGVRDYSVFVSEEGGPFASWIRNTATASATFSGTVGNRYSFYSIARDQTGNVEVAKSAAEASTKVLTVKEADSLLIERVTALQTIGVLNQGQANSLKAKLEAAMRQLDKGNTNPAMNELRAFINQVNALMNAKILSATQGQSLINSANNLITRITNGTIGKILESSNVQRRAEELPAEYALYQNYPDPFNPSTNIRYDLPTPSAVTLKVYNLLGQEVATLLAGELREAGRYEVRFDGARLASGIYFYRLDAISLTSDKKLISLKKMLLMK